MTPKTAKPVTYQLKITLVGAKPPIWRRIEVPSSILLCCLHDILQITMGWNDAHMHQFTKDGKSWGVASQDEFNEPGLKDEEKTKLSQLLKATGQSFFYEYDFGDNWRHKVVLEKITPDETGAETITCLAGARACPPEDIGGIHRYDQFLKSLADPTNKDFEDVLQWMEDDFNPAAFSIPAVQEIFSEMELPFTHERCEY